MTRRAVIRGLVAAAVAVAALAQSMPAALAKYISAATPSHAITGHTLVAPVLSCSATGSGLTGAHIHLTWPATSDSTIADKYIPANFLTDGVEVDTGTTNGGPYSVLATLARTAISYDDNAPAGGTSYYVVRTTKQLWRSANSNQRTASVQLLSASCS